MRRFFLLAAYVALVLVSTCVENSSAEKAPSSFLRTAHLARALEGTCQLEGNNDCELLTETECKNTNLECTWESDVNCCEDGGGAGPNFSLDNFSLDELDALVVLQCIAGVFAITFLNMIFLAIIYHKQHLANLSKSLLASASQAQGVVLETTRKQSSGEGATTYTYFVSFQVYSSTAFQPFRIILSVSISPFTCLSPLNAPVPASGWSNGCLPESGDIQHGRRR